MRLKNCIFFVMLCLSAFCIECNAQRFSYTYKSVKFNCKVNKETVCITGFDRNATDITIPAVVSYNGREYQVTKVDTYISGDNYLAENMVIENGIKEIANYSFIEFRLLRSVTLPSSLLKVGNKSFAHKDRINFINVDIQNNYVVENDDNILQDKKNHVSYVKSPKVNIEKESVVNEDNSKMVVSKGFIADVDNVPNLNHRNEDSFAVIIANEEYDYENNVDYALRDGRTFKEYCIKVLGVPEEHIRLIENATYNQIRRWMDWLKDIADKYSDKCKIYIYYAGHGMPDEKNGCAYLLPSDGYAENIRESGYKMSELYDILGRLPAESVTVFLDACFTGMKRDGKAILAARSVAILPEEEELSGKVMVFAATSELETAYSYNEQGHGLFTYYLLKKLKETQGNVSYGELSKYILREVSRKSLVLNDKSQTPTVNVSPDMKIKWKKMNFGINNKNKKK